MYRVNLFFPISSLGLFLLSISFHLPDLLNYLYSLYSVPTFMWFAGAYAHCVDLSRFKFRPVMTHLAICLVRLFVLCQWICI